MAHTVLINLDARPDRLEYQQKLAERHSLHFERLSAVTGADVSDREYAELAFGWLRPASRNEVACFLSHQLAWRLAAERDTPTLILEDDVVYDHSLIELLGSLPSTDEPTHWNLEAGYKRKLLSTHPAERLGRFRGYAIHLDRGGAAGYVITPAAARLLIRQPRARNAAPPDHYLHGFPGIRHVQVEPAPVTQLRHHEWRLGLEEQLVTASTLTPGRENMRLRRGLQTSAGRRFRLRRLRGEARSLAIRLSLLGRSQRRMVESWDGPNVKPRAA